jgi:hypothetical protein
MIKLLFKAPILIIVLIAAGYVVYNPQVIPNESLRQSVTQAKEQMLGQNPETSSSVLGAFTQAKDSVVEWAQSTKLPPALTGQKQEIVVDEYVKGLTDQVKQLPADQLHRVKQQFCQDIVTEATKSAGSN